MNVLCFLIPRYVFACLYKYINVDVNVLFKIENCLRLEAFRELIFIVIGKSTGNSEIASVRVIHHTLTFLDHHRARERGEDLVSP